MAARSETQRRLTRAAYNVIARDGAHRLSMQSIADDAAVSKGLIHYHFASKAALICEALEWAIGATADRIRSTLALPEYADDPLTALVDAIFVDAEANRGFYLAYVDMVEHSSREESFGDFPELARDVIEGLYAEVIRAGNTRGRIDRPDVDQAAGDVRVIVDGVFIRWLQTKDWSASHAACRDRCRDLLRVVLNEDARNEPSHHRGAASS